MGQFLTVAPTFAGTVPARFWHEFRRFPRVKGRSTPGARHFGTCVSIWDRTERIMGHDCEIAIIGAGPYGLSLAAHLHARGIDCRIFGRVMDPWTSHMPKNMTRKPEAFAPTPPPPPADSTIKAYFKQKNIPYADQTIPVRLDDFLS